MSGRKKNVLQAPDLRAAIDTTQKTKVQAPDLRSSSILAYLLRIQKSHGPVLTWNGKSFANRPGERSKMFSRAVTAKREGQQLLKQFPILKHYRMWVDSDFYNKPAKGVKHRTKLRGGTHSNPTQRSQHAELKTAAKKLENFSGHPVQHLESAYSRSPQQTGLIIGELDLIGYRATRDGKTERYGHPFRKNSRPLLAVTSDGKQLHIVGGQYEFTEAGIEDR
jgi:hypothetical protein